MLINDMNIKSLRMTKLFRENTERINACDFSRNGLSSLLLLLLLIELETIFIIILGDLLISSSDDDNIVVYDCEAGL